MYATQPMGKQEIALCKTRLAGFLGHIVTGYDQDCEVVIETNSETQAASIARVCFIRRRMPNGRDVWRRIVSRPEVRS